MYLISGLLFIACAKDEGMLLMQAPASESPAPEADAQTREGLIQNSDGTWTAVGRRVPLVGAGRVIDDISASAVAVASASKNLNGITNLDITDYADFSGINVNAVVNQIVSVKDMYRTYSAGQKVGFVIGGDGSSVLDVDVLSFFQIRLYNKGVPTDTFELGESDGKTLDLDVLKLTSTGNNHQQVIEVTATQPFDEVSLWTAGIDAGIGSMAVYYAFVGETKEKIIYSGDGASIKEGISWTGVVDLHPEDLLDQADDDGVRIYGVPLVDFVGIRFLTVDFGSMNFEPGTELGFQYSQGELLNFNLLSTVSLTAYDSSWNETGDEFTSTNMVGLSALGGGNGAYSLVTTNSNAKGLKILFNGVHLDLGALYLKRVFSRDPIKVDPTSYYTAQKEVTVSKSSYSFMKPLAGPDGKTGEVTLQITGISGETEASIAEIDQVGKRITGMQNGATYTVLSTFTMADGSGSFTAETVIHREKADDAVPPTYMINKNGFKLEDGLSTGGITLISGMENPENITDDNISNSATCVKAISLIDVSDIVSIVREDDLGAVNTNGKELRVGFALQANSELLSLWALDFFTIELYKDGNKVETKVPANNQTVSLGLLGGSNKMMVSVITDQPFDKAVLRTAGVASISLSSLKIYYGFYEETNGDYSEDAGVVEWCTETMSAASNGMWIDYDKGSFAVVSVVNTLSDMGNIIDDDRETYSTLYQVANIGALKFSVHFDPVKTRQWLGMIVRDPSGLLSVDLLSNTTMNVYSEGTLVQTLGYEDFSVLGLQLIGFGDKSYMEIYPTAGDYIDEIELVMGGVNLAKGLNVYGVYMRPDSDGDGVPDCSEDEDVDDPDNMFANPQEYHVCSGSPVTVNISGGELGTEYNLTFTDQDGETIERRQKMTTNRQFEVKNLPAEKYSLSIMPVTGVVSGASYPTDIKVYVHPSETTWSGEKSSDWNDWGNWVEGAPWTCSNVVIPGGRSNYPVLKASDNAVCRYIQFTPGGEVAGTQYLDYEKAWVNVALPNGKYSMFSSPLKETYTGDMFISEYEYTGKVIPAELGATEDGSVDYSLCWLPLNGSTYPVDRFSPKVYQRAWNRAVQSSGMDGYYDVDLDSEYWTEPYNLVSDPYIAGHGILIRPYEEGKGSGESVFCLPKEYDEYEYYDLVSQTMTGRKDAVERTEKYAGRFIYEDASGNASFPLHVLLENERPSDTYLAGNPFMCHISLKKFFASNPAVYEVKSLKKDGDRYWYETVKKDDESDKKVGPAEGFLVKVGGVYAETSRFRLYIHFTEDMMVTD